MNASLGTLNTSYRSYLVFDQPQKMSTIRGSERVALCSRIIMELDIHHVRQPKYGCFSVVAKKEDDRSQVSLIQQSFAYSGDARWNDATV